MEAQKAVSNNTLIKYRKYNVRRMDNPSVFACGCNVEAVFLDDQGNETDEKYNGQVDKYGKVIDGVTGEDGLNLGRPGVYKITFIGAGMHYLYAGIITNYFEVFNTQSTQGFVTIINPELAESGIFIDYNTGQVKFYKDGEMRVAIGLNVMSTPGEPGIILKGKGDHSAGSIFEVDEDSMINVGGMIQFAANSIFRLALDMDIQLPEGTGHTAPINKEVTFRDADGNTHDIKYILGWLVKWDIS